MGGDTAEGMNGARCRCCFSLVGERWLVHAACLCSVRERGRKEREDGRREEAEREERREERRGRKRGEAEGEERRKERRGTTEGNFD